MYTYRNLFNGELELREDITEFGFTARTLRYHYHAAVRAAKKHDCSMYDHLQLVFEILKALWEFDVITFTTCEAKEKLRQLIIKIYERSFTPW